MTDFSGFAKDLNDNQPYIVDLPQTPNNEFNGSNDRTILPSIQDVSLRGNSRINEIYELNRTQQNIKNLEIRLQATEVSNRTLISEVVRLQNEMITSLRNNLETLNEEKSARQLLEMNFKLQRDAFYKTNIRLKQTEDLLQENRNAMQSIIKYTRNIENSLLESQRDLFFQKDLQANCLETLKKQIDNLQFSKENLERNTNSLLDETKNLKNKIEAEYFKFNSIGGDLKYKAEKLEDENKLQLDVIRKQKDSLVFTENQIQVIQSDQENKFKELRDYKIELKQKLDYEIELRKSNEKSMSYKISELNSKLDDEKSKFPQLIRDMEFFKNEIFTRSEEESKRILKAISDTKEIVWSNTLDKIEKNKNDTQLKLNYLEKNINTASENLDKLKQIFYDEIDSKITNLKDILLEEIGNNSNETGNSFSKLNDIIKKLNDGLTLIERQNDEKNRRFEKVLNAEINSRKSKDVDLNEKLDNNNEKLTVAVQSLQANLGKLATKLDSIKDQFLTRKEFDSFEKKIEELQSSILQNNLKISSLKENIDLSEANIHQQATRIKEINDLLSQIDNSKLVLINNRIDKLPTKEDLLNFKTETDEKLEKEIQRIIKQNDMQYSDIKKTADDRYEQLYSQLTSSNNKFQQKLNMNEKLIKEQISLQNEYQQKYMNMFKEETRASILNYDDKKQEELTYMEEKLQNKIDANKQYYEKKIQAIEQETKNEISSIKNEMKRLKENQKNENNDSDQKK